MANSRYSSGGYEPRFKVARTDGKAIDPDARYMVLRFDGADPHAILALQVYAASVRLENPALADDLMGHLSDPTNAPPQY